MKIALRVGFAAFFLLFGYELLRSASNTLFNFHIGVEYQPLANGTVPFLLILVLVLTNWSLSRLGPLRTMVITSVFSFGFLSASSFSLHQGMGRMAFLLYWIREIYVIVLIEQFWSLLNSVFDTAQAKKFNGPIIGMGALGATLGGAVGAKIVATLGTEFMVFLAGASVLPSLGFIFWAYRLAGSWKISSPPTADPSGFFHLMKTGSLRTVFYLVLLSQVVSTVATQQFQFHLHEAFPDKDLQSQFSYQFYSILNFSSLILPFTVAPLFMRFIRIESLFFLIPIVHLGLAFWAWGVPGLTSAGALLLAFKSLDYSLFRAIKETYYIPLDFDSRFRSKQIIDVFGYRASKAGTSWMIVAVGYFLPVAVIYSPVAVAASGLWAILLGRRLRS